MILHLKRFDIDPGLVLLLDGIDDGLDHHVGDVVHVSSTLSCGDAVDEAHLLEAVVGHSHSNLPSLITILINTFQFVASFIFLVFDEEFNVIFEALDRNLFTIEENFYTSSSSCGIISPVNVIVSELLDFKII